MKTSEAIRKYMLFYKQASTIYDIHSPLAYELSKAILNPDKIQTLNEQIDELKRELSLIDPIIEGIDHGPQGVARKNSTRSFIKKASCPERRGRVLHTLVSHFRPKNILELGTGLGFSAVYMAKALNKNAQILSVEGHEGRAKQAHVVLEKMHVRSVEVQNNTFKQAIKELKSEAREYDLLYIDGDHYGPRLLDNLEACKPLLSNRAIVILDDIRWSNSMLGAWNTIYDGSDYGLALDFFNLGVIVKERIGPSPIRARLVPYWLKPWRAGFFTSS